MYLYLYIYSTQEIKNKDDLNLPNRKQNPLLRQLKFTNDSEFNADIDPPEITNDEQTVFNGHGKSAKLILETEGKLRLYNK